MIHQKGYTKITTKAVLIYDNILRIFATSSSAKGSGNVNPKIPGQINFKQSNLFPEGMAYDPLHHWFILSSADHGTVGILTTDGVYKPLISDPVLTSTSGIKVDKSGGRIWVCNVGGGVGTYKIGDATPVFYSDFASQWPAMPLFINDVAIDPAGNAYVTNSAFPVIFKVDKTGKASVFFENNAFATNPDEFGFNGIQYDSRGFLLVAHTASNQVVKIPIQNPSGYSTVTLDAPLSFPDGMLLSKDGKQLVVVSDDKVVSFITNDEWKTGKLSTSFTTGPVFATSLTSNGNRVFAIYCHLDKLLAGENQDTFTVQEVKLKMPDAF